MFKDILNAKNACMSSILVHQKLTNLVLTSQSGPIASRHRSCHIRHQKWPAAGLAWRC